MEDEVSEDCIVVARGINPPCSNKATSESDGNDPDRLTDKTAAQNTDPVENIKPIPPSQEPKLQTQVKMSPSKAHKVKAQRGCRPRSQFQVQSDVGDDCDYDPSEDDDGALSDVAEPVEPRINLRSKETREQQDVRLSLDPSHTTDDMRAKRPRSPDSGDDQPLKRTVHNSLDGAGDRRRGDSQTGTRYHPVQRLAFMGRGKPRTNRQEHVSRRRDTPHGRSKPVDSSRRGKDTNTTNIQSDTSGYLSSDMPLTVRRVQKKENAQAKALTDETGDDSDDIPIASTVRRRLRTRGTSTSESNADIPSPQPQTDRTQPLSEFNQALKDQLDEAKQELDTYRVALKKERAKSYSLEQQRLLWQAKKLTAQDGQEATAQRKLLPVSRSSLSIAVQAEPPRIPLQVTRVEYQRVLDLNKQLEGRLWDAEFAMLKMIDDPKDYNLKQAVQKNEQQVDVKGKNEALFSAEQEMIAITQERESAQQDAEKARRLEDQVVGLTQKLQQRETALKEEAVNCQFLRSTVLNQHEQLSEQRQQLSDRSAKETARKNEIFDLVASNSQLQQKVEQLKSELQDTIQQSRSVLQSSVETQTQELSTELHKRQTTIEQLKGQVEDIQEELDWYKDQLEKSRSKYQEDMRARDRAERERILYIYAEDG